MPRDLFLTSNISEKMEAKTSRSLKMKMKSRRKKQIKRWKQNAADLVTDNSDCYEYLMRIANVIETVRNDEYEMEVLAGNVFKEIKGNEVSYAKIGFTSKLLENLLPYANHEDFNEFIANFVDNLRPTFSDRTASHILQTIVMQSFKRYVELSSGLINEKLSQYYLEIVNKVARFALNNLESFIWEPSSNHVIRTVLNVLHGQTDKGVITDSNPKFSLPLEFHSLLEKYSQVVVGLPDFHELCNQRLTSGLLQILLLSVKQLEEPKKALIKKIIQLHRKEDIKFEDEKSEPLLRLIETALEVANEKQFKKLYNIFFSHNLKLLSLSKTGNFAVQKLIRDCKEQELFEAIVEELQPVGESILEARISGVLLEIAQGCVRFKTKQGEFVKMMMRILQCQKTLNEDSDITPLCCSLVTSGNYDADATKINLHGTLIVQAMLNFGKPIKIINSLLNMEPKYLLQIICDQRGCHIIDAFIQSSTVGEKSRDRLFKKLLGSFTQLAMSKHGSRSLDAIWNGISTKNKVLLMEELAANESELNSNQFGKLFSRKTYLSNFRRSREEWIKREKALESTKKCFSDIIPCKKPKLEL